ncbi:PD-(D/E)XK nuclease-like domain-containing protein [Leucobacter sp. Z1108]|uniref:PD-(D/E)XK nuclease-like domain-containing protein n=1 Tax=Leucobacter sp. Z1108 TaxID=3439066 RepID=UPI003F30C0A4
MSEPMARIGLVLGMPENEYHHGGPEFSSSAAKAILETPAHYKWEYIDGHKRSSKAFDVGTAVHSKVLGVGAEVVAYPEELLAANGAASTTAAKKFKSEQVAAGKIVMKKAEVEEINIMAESALAHPLAGAILEHETGHSEASVFATDPETGLQLRARFDRLLSDRGLSGDVKTTPDVSRRAFATAIARYKYHVQRAHYLHVARLIGLDISDMVFIAVQNTAPYLTTTNTIDSDFAAKGEELAVKARRTLVQCVETDQWPGYSTGLEMLRLPGWAVFEYQDLEEMELEG